MLCLDRQRKLDYALKNYNEEKNHEDNQEKRLGRDI